jgi:hypothetical protein
MTGSQEWIKDKFIRASWAVYDGDYIGLDNLAGIRLQDNLCCSRNPSFSFQGPEFLAVDGWTSGGIAKLNPVWLQRKIHGDNNPSRPGYATAVCTDACGVKRLNKWIRHLCLFWSNPRWWFDNRNSEEYFQGMTKKDEIEQRIHFGKRPWTHLNAINRQFQSNMHSGNPSILWKG